jgi:hypothetical protein
MIKKNIYLIVVVIIAIILSIFFLTKNNKSSLDQDVYKDTLSISKKYAILRYRSDNVLVKAKDYKEYDDWNNEMSSIIEGWKTLESEVLELEKNADKLANEKTAFSLIKDVYAYNSVEIQKVIESAPAGKQVRTLAQHLGVDVKRAHLILNESQNRISQEIWTGEGDVYEGLEQDAMRIKNGAKVTVFVGGVVLTGGASGVLATTATVVGGADLVLEVADDEARIALGDKNKVSEMVNKARAVTEPAASILTIASMPGNVSKAMEKVSAGYFAADQVRSAVQDQKILGISIKVNEKGEVKTSVAGLTEKELPEWMKENNIVKSGESVEEIMKQIEEEIKPANVKDSGEAEEEKNNTETTDQSEQPQETKSTETDQKQESETSNNEQSQETATNSIAGQSIAGTYSGSAVLQSAEEDIEADESLAVTLQLNESGTGTANVYGYDGVAQYAGNNVSFSVKMKESGYVLNAVFSGKATRNGNQTVISGTIRTSMMGVTVATYSWSAQK